MTAMAEATAYQWVSEFRNRYKVDPTLLGNTIDRLRERDGMATPEALLEEATPKSHPLHNVVFDRPVEDAARQYYLNRCMKLIVAVRRVEGPEAVPEFVHVTTAVGRGYVSQGDLVRPDYRASAVEEAKQYLLRGRRRFGWVSELAMVWEAIDAIGEEAA